jgi:hypothetical protein
MKQSEFKKILKPLIKQCIKEVIFDEGVLSGIISEVVKGTDSSITAQEVKTFDQEKQIKQRKNFEDQGKIKLQETRKRMLDAIGIDSFNGIDVFENTEPLNKAGTLGESKVSSPLEMYAPEDPGVDISKLFNPRWKEMV